MRLKARRSQWYSFHKWYLVENFEQFPLDNIKLRTTFALPFEKQHSSLIIQKVLSVATTPSQKRTSQKKYFPENLEMWNKRFYLCAPFREKRNKMFFTNSVLSDTKLSSFSENSSLNFWKSSLKFRVRNVAAFITGK